MDLYLLYEFTYHNYDDDIMECVDFFGLHKNKEDAIKEALERVIKGYVECDLLPETFNYNGDYPITEESKKQKILEKLKKTNYFHHKNNVIMCRIYDKSIEVYSINIKKFHKKKGDKKYE